MRMDRCKGSPLGASSSNAMTRGLSRCVPGGAGGGTLGSCCGTGGSRTWCLPTSYSSRRWSELSATSDGSDLDTTIDDEAATILRECKASEVSNLNIEQLKSGVLSSANLGLATTAFCVQNAARWATENQVLKGACFGLPGRKICFDPIGDA